MRIIRKLLLLILLLIALVLAACTLAVFYPVPTLQATVQAYLHAYPWLYDVLAGYSAALCLLFMLLLLITLFIPISPRFLVVKKGKGRLLFSKRAVEATARYSFAGLADIEFAKIRIKLHRKPEKLRVYVTLYLSGTGGLSTLSGTVQERIATALQVSLGIAVKSITVKVIECKPGDTAKGVPVEETPGDAKAPTGKEASASEKATAGGKAPAGEDMTAGKEATAGEEVPGVIEASEGV